MHIYWSRICVPCVWGKVIAFKDMTALIRICLSERRGLALQLDLEPFADNYPCR